MTRSKRSESSELKKNYSRQILDRNIHLHVHHLSKEQRMLKINKSNYDGFMYMYMQDMWSAKCVFSDCHFQQVFITSHKYFYDNTQCIITSNTISLKELY